MKYKVGDFIFEIHTEESLDIPRNFSLFQIQKDERVQMEYSLKLVDRLPKPGGECISKRKDIQIYKNGQLEARVINVAGNIEPYGVYQEVDEKRVSCYLKREFKNLLTADTIFTSLFALEKQMIQRSSMVLHCSVLKMDGQVVLLSGPSGIGKSTHADLWSRYRKVEVINGDRTLIKKENGRWISEGWPICGSSEICKNESYPIRAIVFLNQAKENQGQQMGYVQSVKSLISQMTINNWNIDFVQKVWSMVEELAVETPIYQYKCNVTKKAVEMLEKLLEL